MNKKDPQATDENSLTIKNMVCPRCIMAVEQVLQKAGVTGSSVVLGEVALKEPLTSAQKAEIDQNLKKLGFEVLTDVKEQVVAKIKTLIIELIQQGELERGLSLSSYLQQHLLKEYSTLTRLFSTREGITIERYFNLQRIEKAKELLQYNQQTIKEIAYSLGFSSSQHFSSNFKEYMGQTPQEYRISGTTGRTSLDEIENAK